MDESLEPVAQPPGPPPARRGRKPPALVARELNALEVQLGGRPAIIAALSQAPKSADLDYVLGLVADPLNASESLAAICAQGGITAGELMEAYRQGILFKGQVLAARVIAEELPAVAADTMKLAKPYEDTCNICQGTTTVVPEPPKKDPNPAPTTCPACRGVGRLTYPGDLEHKKLALELGKLTSKGAGVIVDNRQAHLHTGGEAAGGTLEALMRATDQLLYGGDVRPRPGTRPSQPGTEPHLEEIVDAERITSAPDAEGGPAVAGDPGDPSAADLDYDTD